MNRINLVFKVLSLTAINFAVFYVRKPLDDEPGIKSILSLDSDNEKLLQELKEKKSLLIEDPNIIKCPNCSSDLLTNDEDIKNVLMNVPAVIHNQTFR